MRNISTSVEYIPAPLCVCAWTVGCGCVVRIRSKRGNSKICSTNDAQHRILIARKSSDLHSPASTFFFFFFDHFILFMLDASTKILTIFLISSPPSKKCSSIFSLLLGSFQNYIWFQSNFIRRIGCCCRCIGDHTDVAKKKNGKYLVWAACHCTNPLGNFITPIKLEKNDLYVQCVAHAHWTAKKKTINKYKYWSTGDNCTHPRVAMGLRSKKSWT